MKKLSLISLAALLIFVTGCGGSKNKVTCTASEEVNGIKMSAEIIAEFDNDDKLKDATMEYDFGDSSTAEQFCSYFEMMENEENGVKVNCSGSKITITGYAQLESDDEDVIGLTKDEFIKKIESAEEGTYKCSK